MEKKIENFESMEKDLEQFEKKRSEKLLREAEEFKENLEVYLCVKKKGQDKIKTEFTYNIDFQRVQIYKIEVRPAYLGL